jgi:hypothetical protein
MKQRITDGREGKDNEKGLEKIDELVDQVR